MVNKTACLLIKGSKEETQDVGYRIFLFTKLDGYGLKVGKPINIPGGGLRIVVNGDEDIIKAAVEDLKQEKPEDASEKVLITCEFGDYELIEFTDRELRILNLNQLSKGIPAIGRMEKEVHNLNQSIGKTSPEEIGIKEVVTGLNNKYHTISVTLEAQLIVSFLILIAAVYALFFLLK